MNKYSVLMSVYNKENPEYLSLAINSMLNQTVKPDEIVIVKDDVLSNELNDVVENYKKEYTSLFNVVGYEENKGLGYALNYGLNRCKNNLVARMDADDISKPDRCEKELKEFELDNKLSIVGTNVDEFYETTDNIISKRVVPSKYEDIYNFGKRRSPFNHPTVMFKKDDVLSIGGYNDSLRRNQDIDLFGRMMFNGLKGKNINESLLFFRTNRDLSERRKSWENTKSYIDTIKRFYKMGYSKFSDYLVVLVAQLTIYIMPASLQNYIYKKLLRK